MVERIFPAAHIEGVAVGQKYLPAQFLDSAYNGLGIIRPQKSQVAQLAEMDFDRHILVRKINVSHARRQNEAFQLGRDVFCERCLKACKVYL